MQSKPGSMFEAAREILAEAASLNEAAKPVVVTDDESMQKAVVKIFPKADTKNYPDHVYWSKRGGYAGEKMQDKFKEKLKALGFKKGTVSGAGTPDGSNVGFRETFVHKKLGWVAEIAKMYGSTASSNSYVVNVKKIK